MGGNVLRCGAYCVAVVDKCETFQAAWDDCDSTLQRLSWSSREVGQQIPDTGSCHSASAWEKCCRYAV